MQRIEIKTSDMGTLPFIVADAGGYVRDEQGRQYCEGGSYQGVTLLADGRTLRAVAERWVKARRRAMLGA